MTVVSGSYFIHKWQLFPTHKSTSPWFVGSYGLKETTIHCVLVKIGTWKSTSKGLSNNNVILKSDYFQWTEW